MSSGIEKVLVTGGTGYLGSHVTKKLLQEGCKVRTTVRSLMNEAKMKVLKSLEKFDQIEVVEANLLDAASIDRAVEGCSHVLHVASPFPIGHSGPAEEVINPALLGTKAVLEACKKHKVKRLVVTGSVMSVIGDHSQRQDGVTLNESDWACEDSNNAYLKSKLLSEKAVWDFYKDQGEKDRLEIVVLLPAFIQGPTLGAVDASSFYIMKNAMEMGLPFVVHINISYIDVRDVALAHYKALTLPEAEGKRIILCEGNHWLKDMTGVLNKEFKEMGYRIPTSYTLPSFLVRFFSYFNADTANAVPYLDKQIFYDNSTMTKVLGIEPLAFEKTIIDTAYSLIDHDVIKKTAQYHPRDG